MKLDTLAWYKLLSFLGFNACLASTPIVFLQGQPGFLSFIPIQNLSNYGLIKIIFIML